MALDDYDLYAAGYVAHNCLVSGMTGEGRSSEGFRSFVDQTLFLVRASDGVRRIAATADSAIEQFANLAETQ